MGIPVLVLFSLLIHLYAEGVDGETINLTIVESGIETGAVCLDGSAPSYYLNPGFDDGITNWVLLLEGGGWCIDEQNCESRVRENYFQTSSKNRAKQIFGFQGLLNINQTANPDFYNWNKVYVNYCDLGSYTGDVENIDPRTNLHIRGSRVFNATIQDLLAKGMKNATNAILSGVSAGGLGALLHCDEFKSRLPTTKRVKCFSDAGYFIRGIDLPGVNETILERPYMDMVSYHILQYLIWMDYNGMERFLPESCTRKMDPKLCLYPENFIQNIQTPVFLLNSAFDRYQIIQKVLPGWDYCKFNFTNCPPIQLQAMRDFRRSFINALLPKRDNSSSIGMFIHSCVGHEHLMDDKIWSGSGVPDLKNKTPAQAFGDWYFDRVATFQEIDASDNPCFALT